MYHDAVQVYCYTVGQCAVLVNRAPITPAGSFPALLRRFAPNLAQFRRYFEPGLIPAGFGILKSQ